MFKGVPAGHARGNDDAMLKFDLVLHRCVVLTAGSLVDVLGVG